MSRARVRLNEGVGRTAFLIPSLRGGGAERVMVNLVRAWVEAGLPADLLVCQATGPYLEDVPAGVPVIDLRSRRVSRAVPAIASYLRTMRPTALLAALDHANVAALLARRLAGGRTRVVVSVHAAISQVARASAGIKPKLLYGALRWTYPLADAIVAVSDGVAADLARTAHLSRSSIRVIYNPIVTPELPMLAEQPVDHPWFTPGQPPVVLGVGRLEPQKDFGTLLEAFAIARRARPLRLVILGEGLQAVTLRDRAEALGIARDVWFAGFQRNPYAFMRRAGVLALSSVYEGFGNVLVEAMACGTPVVSTDCESGPSEILDGGRLGALVSVGDSAALASAILTTLIDPPMASVLRAGAEGYTASGVAEQYRELLLGPTP
ncbi:MAG: glycosyltransferase [Gemmatimonadota bacterium]